MAKYGKGFGIELVEAFKSGEITEPITRKTLDELCEIRGFKCPESYLNVFLANSSSTTHSHTYKKYVESIGDGNYIIAKEYR
mgnify:FL=1